jgi:hypothetical protein
MTFNPSDSYGVNKIVLAVEGEYAGHQVEAYCSPDSEGKLYSINGGVFSEDAFCDKRNGAPFDFDVVFVGDGAENMNTDAVAEELGDAFDEEFSGKVDAVYDIIEGNDDPLETIKEMNADDL